MIEEQLVAKQINNLSAANAQVQMELIDEYGAARSEVLGYVFAFQEYLSMRALDELLQFFVFLVLLYESAGYGRLQPDRDTILKKQKSVHDQVQFVLGKAPGDLFRSSENYAKNLSEPAVVAYALNDFVKHHDMHTEAGVQMYVAVVSLIEIFSASAGK